MAERRLPPLAAAVALTRGYEAFVSLVDLDLIRPFSWRVQLDNKDTEKQYAATEFRDGSRRRKLYMHRLITGAGPGMIVDHVNHDGIDNTRRNLRVCGFGDNMQNAQLVRARSGYRGVSQMPNGSYRGRIAWEGEEISLGSFRTALEAAEAYDRKALALYGPMAWTNIERDRGELADVYDLSSLPF